MLFPDITKPPLEHGILNLGRVYDPVKAHEYYLRTRKLKGRKRGSAASPSLGRLGKAPMPSTSGVPSKAAQRAKVAKQISDLRTRLTKLNAELKKRVAEAEKAKREAGKPKTAAEQRDAAKSAKKYRDKNQQKIANEQKKTASKDAGGSTTKKAGGQTSIEDLKATISKVRDQLTAAVARQRALR